MAKLRRFKGIKNPPLLRRLKDFRGDRLELPDPPRYDRPEKHSDPYMSFSDPDIQEIVRKFGDNGPETVQKARRVLGIMRQNPNLSDIEATAEEYARRHSLAYELQVSVHGGRNAPAGSGGSVLDMVVFFGGQATVWEIQGNRWHSWHMAGQDDFWARVRGMGYNIDGIPITNWVAIWEDDIWEHGDRVFDAARDGIEWRVNRRVLNG